MPAHINLQTDAALKSRPSNQTTIKTDIERRWLCPYRHTATAQSNDGDSDSDFTISEEETISELDEATLLEIPVRLQDNMRKLPAERICKWQKHQCQHQLGYLYQQDEKPGPESELEPRDTKYGRYGKYAKWFKNMPAKIAVTRQLEAKRFMEGGDDYFEHPDNTVWCPVGHIWVPVYYGQEQKEKRSAMDGDGVSGNRARLCGIGGLEQAHLSQADTLVAKNHCLTPRHDRGGSSNDGYMSWRCAGPYYGHETQVGQDCYQHENQPLKEHSSFVSTVQDDVSAKIQRAQKIFKR